jgi:hypothetical protein
MLQPLNPGDPIYASDVDENGRVLGSEVVPASGSVVEIDEGFTLLPSVQQTQVGESAIWTTNSATAASLDSGPMESLNYTGSHYSLQVSIQADYQGVAWSGSSTYNEASVPLYDAWQPDSDNSLQYWLWSWWSLGSDGLPAWPLGSSGDLYYNGAELGNDVSQFIGLEPGASPVTQVNFTSFLAANKDGDVALSQSTLTSFASVGYITSCTTNVVNSIGGTVLNFTPTSIGNRISTLANQYYAIGYDSGNSSVWWDNVSQTSHPLTNLAIIDSGGYVNGSINAATAVVTTVSNGVTTTVTNAAPQIVSGSQIAQMDATNYGVFDPPKDLNTLFPTNSGFSGFTTVGPHAINDGGAIVGIANQTADSSGNPIPPANQVPHGVMLLPVQVTSVSFDGTKYWQLCSDAIDGSGGHTSYSAPQWADTNKKAGTSGWDANVADPDEHDNAVAFTRNTKPKIGAAFKIPGASNWTNLKFKATGPDGISIPATAGTVGTDGVTVTMAVTESTTTLPNTVKYYNKNDTTAFTLNWSMSVDGGTTWAAISSTKHTVYVTLGDPDAPGSENQETPFYLGCKDGNGVSSQTDLVTGVWNDIKGRKLYRVGTTTAMTYYANSASPYTTCNGLDQLLATGDGRCGSYQLLMLQILYDQGVPTTTALPKIVTPSTDYVSQAITAYEAAHGGQVPNDPTNPLYPEIRNVFFVKNWTLNTTTPFSPVDLTGIPAQGNADPIAVFGDHALVEISGQIYDPSYGDGPYSSAVAWQDASVAGFGVQFIDPSGLAANFVLYVGKLEVAGHQDVNYTDP